MSKKRALLIGNGINRVDPEQSLSWGGLLQQLRQELQMEVEAPNDFKPFPLAFEEILFKGNKEGGGSPYIQSLKEVGQKWYRKTTGQ